MDNGAISYRRFRDEGDESGLADIIREYRDGLIFYLNGFVNNIHVAEEENLERLFIKEERRIMVHRALKKLKPEYHQVLWLIYFESFSNKEAAAVMKKSVHNIETLVYRARKSLRSQLEMEGFEYEEL